MFEVVPRDLAAVHAATAMFWRPMREDHNLKRLQQDARAFMEHLRAVAAVRLRAAVEKARARDPEGDSRERAERPALLEFLNACRAADASIRRAARYVVPDVARFFGSAASELFRLIESAQRNLNDIRAFLAYVLGERDDEELGCEFVPSAPEGVSRTGSVELPDIIPAATCAEPFRLRFTEGAAFQVSEIQARAVAEPEGVHALVWHGIEFGLASLQIPADVFEPAAPVLPLAGIARSRVGKTNIFFIGSAEQRQITVLLFASWAPADEWKALADVRERLATPEWDAAFEELGSYMRPTPRGLSAMIRVLDQMASQRALTQSETTLRERLQPAQPYDAIPIEDVKDAVEYVSSAAEDLIDNEDAEQALAETERVAWDDVKSEFDA